MLNLHNFQEFICLVKLEFTVGFEEWNVHPHFKPGK